VAWFLLFYATHIKGKPDKIYSPKLAFYIAFLENVVEIWSMFRLQLGLGQLFKFFVTISLFKILPLYLIWDIPIIIPRDIYVLVCVFIIYIIYLYAIGTSVLEVYSETAKSLETNGNRTPFYRFIGRFIVQISEIQRDT
jgi:hypothetical protein